MSLIMSYEGDDFGETTEMKISSKEDKIVRDTMVTESASGSYRSLPTV